MLAIYKIIGNSMLPKIKEGDYVLILPFCYLALPLTKITIIFDHPEYGMLIKNINSIDGKNKTVTIQGLNSLSVSSSQLGDIPFSSLKGFVIWRFSSS